MNQVYCFIMTMNTDCFVFPLISSKSEKIGLTLFVAGSKIYVKWRGGLFQPPLCSLRKWPFLVQKIIKPSSPIYLRTLQKVWNP